MPDVKKDEDGCMWRLGTERSLAIPGCKNGAENAIRSPDMSHHLTHAIIFTPGVSLRDGRVGLKRKVDSEE
jgi:hypothetical protein